MAASVSSSASVAKDMNTSPAFASARLNCRQKTAEAKAQSQAAKIHKPYRKNSIGSKSKSASRFQ
ncbi:hypothetical protein N7476_004971 [Penicillium atrosanguineum]|uniref:Uncharacterized protein n=1 Tax=Penicillium atrosanguineum TaxID=1132637 RepID=A0A9W9U629_9EURO|nr:hypothetical protein N7526_001965 [Penicillium atrosanguineum]KAJ5318551.1 hypothetical protein N7476_004971 [Penicillium atrosanguineum]